MKVLIAEDELYARESLQRQIQRYDRDHNFETLTAENGEEGLNLCRKERPDLLIADIRMPKMNGLDLLKEIRKSDARIHVIILSAYSEFDYARSALEYNASDYLLKPVSDEELGRCLDKFLKKNQEDRRNRWISGDDEVTRFLSRKIRDGHDQEYRSFIAENVIRRIFQQWTIAAVQFGEDTVSGSDFIFRMEEEYGRDFWSDMRYTQDEKGLFLFLVKSRNDDILFWDNIRRKELASGRKIWIGISREYSDPGSLSDAYREAVNCLKYHIFEKEGIIQAEAVNAPQLAVYYLADKVENDFRSAVRAGEGREALQILNRIFADIRRKGVIRIECLELVFLKVLLICCQKAGETSVENHYTLEKVSEGIIGFETLDALQRYLSELTKSVCGEKQDGSIYSGNIADWMKKYVDEHYSEDVTLKQLAGTHLYMNENYLSHLFTARHGVSFSSYLRKVRVIHARELLLEGKYSVTEAAGMVGYNDVSQFIRNFRQETGVTPKKYAAAPQEVEHADGL